MLDKVSAFYNYTPPSKDTPVIEIVNDLRILQADIAFFRPEERPSDLRITMLLMALVQAKGPEYMPAVMAVKLTAGPEYDFADVMSRLRGCESIFQELQASKDSAVAASSRKQGQFRGNCYYCDKQGHRKSDCRTLKKEQRDRQKKNESGQRLPPYDQERPRCP